MWLKRMIIGAHRGQPEDRLLTALQSDTAGQ